MMKRQRVPRPPDRSLFRHWIELPLVRFLFRWRRRLHIRLANDPMFPSKGPFVITWNTWEKHKSGSSDTRTYMDWEREQSEEFQRAARQRRRAIHRHPTQRQVNAASAMMRAHDERARAEKETTNV